MTEFEIWSQAYTWCPTQPRKIGKGVGNTFEEACLEWATRTLSLNWFDKNKLTYGGSPLFRSANSAKRK